jgi:hypothetical protein
MFFSKPKVPVPTPTNAATEIRVIADSTPESTSEEQHTSEQNQSVPSASAQLWKSVFKGPPSPPVCKGHFEPCVLKTVKKKAPT